MAGQSPKQAYTNFLNPLDRALGCIARARLTRLPGTALVIDEEFPVALKNGDPAPLRHPDGIYLTAQQRARIVRVPGGREPFKAQTIEYSYSFAVDVTVDNPGGTELLTFHWTPETTAPGEKTFGHLHLGSALLASPAPILPKTLSKAHIPTERLCVEAIVRFAIEELKVVPINPRWPGVLNAGEAMWRKYRTR
jgi:hypothetical protein